MKIKYLVIVMCLFGNAFFAYGQQVSDLNNSSALGYNNLNRVTSQGYGLQLIFNQTGLTFVSTNLAVVTQKLLPNTVGALNFNVAALGDQAVIAYVDPSNNLHVLGVTFNSTGVPFIGSDKIIDSLVVSVQIAITHPSQYADGDINGNGAISWLTTSGDVNIAVIQGGVVGSAIITFAGSDYSGEVLSVKMGMDQDMNTNVALSTWDSASNAGTVNVRQVSSGGVLTSIPPIGGPGNSTVCLQNTSTLQGFFMVTTDKVLTPEQAATIAHDNYLNTLGLTTQNIVLNKYNPLTPAYYVLGSTTTSTPQYQSLGQTYTKTGSKIDLTTTTWNAGFSPCSSSGDSDSVAQSAFFINSGDTALSSAQTVGIITQDDFRELLGARYALTVGSIDYKTIGNRSSYIIHRFINGSQVSQVMSLTTNPNIISKVHKQVKGGVYKMDYTTNGNLNLNRVADTDIVSSVIRSNLETVCIPGALKKYSPVR